MNLAEKLLKIDKGEFNKEKTKDIPSKMLSELFGEKTEITIKAIDPQEVLDISATGLDDEGNPIIKKSLETNSLLAAAAVVNPPLKDTNLLKHLEVTTPDAAALKLFKGEVNKIAIEVNKLAGFDIGNDTDKELKN
nr:MAG TPA: tail assembly chaperone protein [Caudoviricetes sp.]